jgi:hypothetical protein
MSKRVTIADLPTSTLPESGGPGAGLTLYCRACREHYSATRGDYFRVDDGRVLTCCDEPMALARRVTMVEEVS